MATIDEMKAQLAVLKKTSNKMPESRSDEADVAAEIVAEQARLDAEGREALRKLALIREAEAWAKISEADRPRTMITCVIDWPTHKRTMTPGDIDSGRGIIIVTALERGAAAKSLRKRGKFTDDGIALMDMSQEAVSSGLMKATLYPSPDVLQVMLVESEPLCRWAYQEAGFLSGGLAHAVSGKSES